MKNVTAQSVGDSGDGVGYEKDRMKVKGMKGSLPLLIFLLFCWVCGSAEVLLSSRYPRSLKPALSSGPVVGFSLLIYQKTHKKKWLVS